MKMALVVGIFTTIVVFGLIGIIAIPTIIVESYTHYHGEINTTSVLQDDYIISLIKENASNGGFGVLKPDYTILTTTTGNIIIDYDFYSKNKTLPLNYYQK